MAKEIISKRYKNPYIFMFALSLFTIIYSITYPYHVQNPYLLTVNCVCLCLYVTAAILWGSLLADPRGVIEKDGDTIILVRGMRKTLIPVSDIQDVLLTPHPIKKGKFQKHAVTIKAIIKGKEKSLVCPDVIDPEVAVEKLKNILD